MKAVRSQHRPGALSLPPKGALGDASCVYHEELRGDFLEMGAFCCENAGRAGKVVVQPKETVYRKTQRQDSK